MKQRTITGFIMCLILIPLVYLGSWYLLTCACLLSYVGTYELIKMHSEKHNLPKIDKYLYPLASIIVVLIGGFMMIPKYLEMHHLMLIILCIFVIFLIIGLFSNKHHLTDIFLYYSFVLYSGLGIFMAVSCRFITSIGVNTNDLIGIVLLGYLVLCTMFTDIGAYLFGMLFGKHKLCPTISPKKTIEGAIGGSFTGTILGSIFLIVFQNILEFDLFNISNEIINVIIIIVISLVLTIIGQIGDLIASKLKREYGIKDYGFIFPGHGGVMDRFDSLILTGSIFFIILSFIGVII